MTNKKDQNATIDLADRWKAVLSRRYQIFGDDRVEKSVANLVKAYESFIASGCADPDFKTQLRCTDGEYAAHRLGEMLLYERLSHAGFEPKSWKEGPDFLIEKNGEKVWLELVTPSHGGDKKIDKLFKSYNPLFPSATLNSDLSHRLLLRVCAGISAKLEKFEKYRANDVIGPDDPCIIVINDALLCSDYFFVGVSHGANSGISGHSLVEDATSRFGPSIWVKSNIPGRYEIELTYRDETPNRPEPKEDGSQRKPISVSYFDQASDPKLRDLSERSNIISAVMQVTLREDYGYLMILRDIAETEDRLAAGSLHPGIFLRNPNAVNPIANSLTESLMQMANLSPLSPQEAIVLIRRQCQILFGDQPFINKIKLDD